MATIDLTLDSFKVPAIENYTPPFGTKIVKTDANKGGLSTVEVNSNIMMPFTNMRPKVVTEDSTTTAVEYDAKLVFSSSLAAGVTLSLLAGAYEGCEIFVQNLSNIDNTVTTSSWSSELYGNTSVKLVWSGSEWLINDGFSIGDIKPSSLTTPTLGWLECNGQAISRSIYEKLFSKFSTQLYDSDPTHTLLSRYGTGDGDTTFNLPDYRECALVGVGSNGTFITDMNTQNHEIHTLGEFKDDALQGHYHAPLSTNINNKAILTNYGIGSSASLSTSGGAANLAKSTGEAITDGTHGTPRTDYTTHGKQIGVIYLIKVL
jgi:microcystin-dependent protein